MAFDYFTPGEAEQYAFYRVPKLLITGEQFKTLSMESKLLYGILLDRVSLSLRNGWVDEQNHVYIIYTIEQIMQEMNCSNKKAVTMLAELEKKVALIEKKRQGLGKPNLIYVIITHNGDAKPHKDDIFQYANDSTYIQIPKGKLAGGIENERCIQCGAIIWRGNKYCPECGAKQFWKTKSDFNISRVNFSATAPRKLSREAYNIIHLIVYEDEYRSVVNGIVHDKEIPQREIPGGTAEIEDDSVVKIILKSPDFELYYEEERLWKRKYIDFAIPIMLPSELRKKQVMFQAVIYINNIIATRLSFVVKCNSFRTQKISISREDILSAFISYASQDRSKAALIIQGMRKARPDMDIFFDVETLRSGEKWEDAIHQEIRNRDILYLFWSNYAKKSKWVDTEWRYAYSINGEDGIEPMPLEPAWSCPPPDELKNMHFNDNLLYIINQNPPTLNGMIQSQMSDLEEETIIDKDYLIKKMTELKELLEIGLYTPDEYEADRKALLEIYRKQQPF